LRFGGGRHDLFRLRAIIETAKVIRTFVVHDSAEWNVFKWICAARSRASFPYRLIGTSPLQQLQPSCSVLIIIMTLLPLSVFDTGGI
jgi:hypothetical protein